MRSLFSFEPPAFFNLAQSGQSRKTRQFIDTFDDIGGWGNNKSHPAKIWIDNTFRLWISVVALIGALILSGFSSIGNQKVILATFVSYAGLCITANWLYLTKKYHRQFDFVLCSLDIIGITALIYLTGRQNSPFFFIYFIPIILQSFHRDWNLILFYGFGGVLMYSLVIALDVSTYPQSELIYLTARVLCMLLTVSAAILAVQLLKNQNKTEIRRLTRMKLLTLFSQMLNNATSIKDFRGTLEDIVHHLNIHFAPSVNGWVRAFLYTNADHNMAAIMDADHRRTDLKTEIPVSSCPALMQHEPFRVGDTEREKGCPTESFSFRSHLCVPILGAVNESFGVLFAASERPHVFKEEESEFFQFLGRAMGLTLQRLRRVDELQLSLEMDSCAMATFLASTKSPERTYQAFLDGIKNLLKADQAGLVLWDPLKGHLRVEAACGPAMGRELGMIFHPSDGLVGDVFESGKPRSSAEFRTHSDDRFYDWPFRFLLIFPLQSLKGDPLGVVNVWFRNENHPLSSYETDIASTFITRGTLAIENALLHRESIHPKNIEPRERAA